MVTEMCLLQYDPAPLGVEEFTRKYYTAKRMNLYTVKAKCHATLLFTGVYLHYSIVYPLLFNHSYIYLQKLLKY